MKLAERDNLSTEVVEVYSDQSPETTERYILEPSYADYLRTNGYPIRDITDRDIQPSESDTDKCYLVCRVHTLNYPRGHTKLDIEAHKTVLPVCSCWAWRSNSSDISKEGNKPSECTGCKHTRQAYREEKAENDDQQVTL